MFSFISKYKQLYKIMENLEKNTTKEYTKANVDLDDLAKNYAEKVRQSIIDIKNKEDDPHLDYINPSELNHDDLIIFDKFQKGILTELELKDYRNRMDSYFELQRKNKEKDFILHKDGRSNFLAMISNKLISQIFEKRLHEIKLKKRE